jgi:hypothetical protein
MALAYPSISVDGYDVDGPSMEEAGQHAEAAGVSDRVSFPTVDPASTDVETGYDLVTAFNHLSAPER